MFCFLSFYFSRRRTDAAYARLNESMRRRDFIAGLATSAIAAAWPARAQEPLLHPRLLIAQSDPFTGLPLLKARYVAGLRPSEDMEGWALSWQLTGKESFAERALAEMRAKTYCSRRKAARGWTTPVMGTRL